ncbi:MAG: biotin--[acetyl-CoA-carboxylase] ligase [Thermoflexales bacterium]|nr:biotin--[acetyl-CoA-carboxylase] ligase [Thermoflexales bacterium]
MEKTLSQESIERALTGVEFVRRVVYLPQVGSTNDVAQALAADGAPEGTLVIADEQTAGRGRLGRQWWAPAGDNLLLSLLLRPALPPLQALRLTMAAGLAAAEAIEQTSGLAARLKWPNDVWLNGKKAGGSLAETRLAGERLEYAIVGLGLNVNADLSQHAELAALATSLRMESGQQQDRRLILRALVESFAAWYGDISSPRLREAWARRLITLGQQVEAWAGQQSIRGLAEAVDEDGALLVRTANGRLHRLSAGDVSLSSARTGA